MIRILAGVVLAYLLGFFLYLGAIPSRAPARPVADGIVVLTGSNARLDAAVSLFERGVGKRLLVSGAHKITTKEEIGALAHGGRRFECCADVGYEAEDTRGNAIEAAGWAHDNRFNSVIIVTAAYHMPRATAEFAAAMPAVKLIAYPVEAGRPRATDWWHPSVFGTLQGEYAKYLASLGASLFEKPQAFNRNAA